MWQTKYASAVPKNLGLGVDFWPCSEGELLTVRPQSVVKGIKITRLAYILSFLCKGKSCKAALCIYTVAMYTALHHCWAAVCREFEKKERWKFLHFQPLSNLDQFFDRHKTLDIALTATISLQPSVCKKQTNLTFSQTTLA